MSNLINIPQEDNYEATITQVLDADPNALTVYVSRVPVCDIPVGAKIKATINPKKGFDKMECVLIEDYDSANRTLTIAAGGRAQSRYNGDTPTPIEHKIGSKIIISNPYSLWKELQDAVNSKLDDGGGTFEGPVDFANDSDSTFTLPKMTTAERDAIASPANGMVIYNETTGTYQNYNGGTWQDFDIGTPSENASETVKGVVEEATNAETANGTATGDTGAKLFVTPAKLSTAIQSNSYLYAADAESSDAYVITLTPAPTALTIGMKITFKANTANAGAATLNVNGLGAKTIKKQGNIDLSPNDIKANQIVTVVYDGTNFQMQSSVGQASALDLVADLTLGEAVTANDSVAINGDGFIYKAQSDVLNDAFTVIGTLRETGSAADTKPVNLLGPLLTVPTLTATQGRLWTAITQNTSNSTVAVYGVIWEGQTITIPSGVTRIDQIDLHLSLTGSPTGSYTVFLRATDGSGNPTGADLATASLATSAMAAGLNRFSGFNLSVTPGAKYHVGLRNPSADVANHYAWSCQNTDVYSGGSRFDSADSGGAWAAVSGQDFRFIIYYNSAAGSDVFLTDTEGSLSLTPGTYFQRIGRAISATQMIGMVGTPSIYATYNWSASSTDITVDTTVTLGFRPRFLIAYGTIGVWVTMGWWHHGLAGGVGFGSAVVSGDETYTRSLNDSFAEGRSSSVSVTNFTRLAVQSVGPDRITIRRTMEEGSGNNAPSGTIYLAIFG